MSNSAEKNFHYLLAGTYSTRSDATGIYVYRFYPDNGTLEYVSDIELPDPSYLVVSPDQQFVYAALELADHDNGGKVAALSFDQTTGQLTLLNQQLAGGDHTCYVDVNGDNRWLFTGNYSSGTLSVFSILDNGHIGERVAFEKHKGNSLNKERQDKAHIHGTIVDPGNNFLIVPDLGTDEVVVYAIDHSSGKLSKHSSLTIEPGGGPRYISFHPHLQVAYIIEEMGGRINVCDYKDGHLERKQVISTLPAGEKGVANSAHLEISDEGLFLYASNRGEYNSIAIYSIDSSTGKLSVVDIIPSGSKTPRHFAIDPTGHYLLAANQDSNSIVVFHRNPVTGVLKESGTVINVGMPVCLRII